MCHCRSDLEAFMHVCACVRCLVFYSQPAGRNAKPNGLRCARERGEQPAPAAAATGAIELADATGQKMVGVHYGTPNVV